MCPNLANPACTLRLTQKTKGERTSKGKTWSLNLFFFAELVFESLIAGYNILKFCTYMADEDYKALKGWWVMGFTFFGPKNGLEIFLIPVQINYSRFRLGLSCF